VAVGRRTQLQADRRWLAADATAPSVQVLEAICALPNEALTRLCSGPEVSSWLSAMERVSPDERSDLLPYLGLAVAGASVDARIEFDSLPVPRPTGPVLVLPALGHSYQASASGNHFARHLDGHVQVIGGSTVCEQLERIPTCIGGALVMAHHDGWLAHTVPGYENRKSTVDPVRFAALMDDSAAIARDVASEAWEEVEWMLRWILPFDSDSFYVPGIRGLVALDDTATPAWTATLLLHEASHNKLSSIYEVADVFHNPLEECVHPFVREKGPVSSLLHSLWTFVREFALIRDLRAAGYLGGEEGWTRTEKKFLVFFRQGVPRLREVARFTPTGEAIMESLELRIAELV
jgi:HEXXH motif-containing protein